MKDYDEILIALRRITRAIDLHSKQLQKQTGLTTSQLIIMDTIARLGTPSPSAIARKIVLSQATVTSILDRLVASGLAVRTRATDDRRQVQISLTEAGVQKLAGAPELLQQGFLAQFRKLPDWQRSLLLASLQQVAHMMDADELDAAPMLVLGDLAAYE